MSDYGDYRDVEALREENVALRARIEAVEQERDGLAAAVERLAKKCDRWRDTFEGLDQDDFEPEAFAALAAVYDLPEDAEAQDTAEQLLAARDASMRAEGAAEVPCEFQKSQRTTYDCISSGGEERWFCDRCKIVAVKRREAKG